jgi:hypothetical protein
MSSSLAVDGVRDRDVPRGVERVEERDERTAAADRCEEVREVEDGDDERDGAGSDGEGSDEGEEVDGIVVVSPFRRSTPVGVSGLRTWWTGAASAAYGHKSAFT